MNARSRNARSRCPVTFCRLVVGFALSIFALSIFTAKTVRAQVNGEAVLARFADTLRWQQTALQSELTGQGEPATLTWSIVPDQTPILPAAGIGEPQASRLRAQFDGAFGSRDAWASMFSSTFNRWSQLSGVTFLEESQDDGREVFSLPTPGIDGYAGEIGVRGDLRIAGAAFPALAPVVSLGPAVGDLVVNTLDPLWLSASDDLRRRNAIAQAVGVGLGLTRIAADAETFLMEDELVDSFDGPQLDDILVLHRAYGDVYEKPRGNDTSIDATQLGLLFADDPMTVGMDARDTHVLATESAFVSIDGLDDVDYYRFEASTRGFLWVTLVPRGARYSLEVTRDGNSRNEVLDTSALNDLKLELLSSSAAGALASVDRGQVGRQEVINELFIPEAGEFLIRVSGAHDLPQLYSLAVRLRQESGIIGDVNGDGQLTTIDIDQFSARLRQGVTDRQFDLDGDTIVSFEDLRFLVDTQFNTYFGDSNLDGEFNTRDLVVVFMAGKYEDGQRANSTWVSGDWNGDGEFDSSDLVIAFIDGGYEQGQRTAVASIPEPSSQRLLFCACLTLAATRRLAFVTG